MLIVSSEKLRQELELTIIKLQQQLDNVTQRSLQTERELRLALHTEQQAHDSDINRLTADKVLTLTLLTLVTLVTVLTVGQCHTEITAD